MTALCEPRPCGSPNVQRRLGVDVNAKRTLWQACEGITQQITTYRRAAHPKPVTKYAPKDWPWTMALIISVTTLLALWGYRLRCHRFLPPLAIVAFRARKNGRDSGSSAITLLIRRCSNCSSVSPC